MTINFPAKWASLSSGGRRPKNCFSVVILKPSSKCRKIDSIGDQRPHLGLLDVDFVRRVDDRKPKQIDHRLILSQDFGLEDTKAFVGIGAPAHIEASLMVFELWTALQDP